MVEVVVHRPAPERNEVRGVEGEVVPGVILHRLPEANEEPGPEFAHVSREKEGTEEGADAEDERLDGVGVLGGDAEGVRVLVMHLVHVLIHGFVVEAAVHPVKVEVLDDEKRGELPSEIANRREGELHGEAQKLGDPVEEELHGKLDEDVAEEEALEALPDHGAAGALLGLDPVLLEERDLVQQQPGHPAAEVHQLVEDEGEGAGDHEVAEVVEDPRPTRGHLGVHQGLGLLQLRDDVREGDVADAQADRRATGGVRGAHRHDRGGEERRQDGEPRRRDHDSTNV